jgi:hypothetical protein
MKLSDLDGVNVCPADNPVNYNSHIVLLDALISNRIFVGVASHSPGVVCPLCDKGSPVPLEDKVVKLEAFLNLNGQDKQALELFLRGLKLLTEEHGMTIYPKVTG